MRGDFLVIEDAMRGEPWTPADQPAWATNALARVPLFAGVGRRHLRKIIKLIGVRTYSDGLAVVRAGSRGEAFFIVLDGKALVRLAGGDEIVLRPGDAFGELALIDGAPRSATVIADEGLVAGRMARTDFRRLLRDEPTIAVALLPGLAVIIRQLLHERQARKHPSSKQRVAQHPEHGRWYALPSGREVLEWKLALHEIPAFATLPDRHLKRVARMFAVNRYGAGTMVTRQGEPGEHFMIVLDGHLEGVAQDGSVYDLAAGASFGELSLIDGAPRALTVTAKGDATVAMVSRRDFQKLLKDEPRLGIGIAESLVRVIRTLQA